MPRPLPMPRTAGLPNTPLLQGPGSEGVSLMLCELKTHTTWELITVAASIVPSMGIRHLNLPVAMVRGERWEQVETQDRSNTEEEGISVWSDLKLPLEVNTSLSYINTLCAEASCQSWDMFLRQHGLG